MVSSFVLVLVLGLPRRSSKSEAGSSNRLSAKGVSRTAGVLGSNHKITNAQRAYSDSVLSWLSSAAAVHALTSLKPLLNPKPKDLAVRGADFDDLIT
jgi:hypothetical protein